MILFIEQTNLFTKWNCFFIVLYAYVISAIVGEGGGRNNSYNKINCMSHENKNENAPATAAVTILHKLQQFYC